MPKNTQANTQFLRKREEDKNYLTQPNVTSVRSRIFQNYVRERNGKPRRTRENNEKS